jgi:hypothetical protein
MKYRIRYNKSAGQPGRGTTDHKWRVFDETGKEIICKGVIIRVTSQTEADPNGADCNITCEGQIKIDREKSIVEIV